MVSIGGFSHTSEGPKSPKSLLVRTWNNCIQKGLNHRIKMGFEICDDWQTANLFHGSFVSRSIRSTSLCKQTILTSTRRTNAWKIPKWALVLECAGIVQRIYLLGIQHLSIELSVIATVFLVDRSGSDQSGCLFSESAILNFRSAGARACEHFQGLALDGWELNFSEGRS